MVVIGSRETSTALSTANGCHWKVMRRSGSTEPTTNSTGLPAAVRAAMGPADKFDLVIRGGDLLDPASRLRGIRDIGIRNGRIEAVETAIPPERAAKTLDARGKLVVPGLIDLHAHVYPYGS